MDLDESEAKVFRGLAATLNYMSQDAPDLQFPIKDCSRSMATPKQGSWRGMKRVARYLLNREKVVWGYVWQEEVGKSYVITDSDWGGTSRERKSTSGGRGCWEIIV